VAEVESPAKARPTTNRVGRLQTEPTIKPAELDNWLTWMAIDEVSLRHVAIGNSKIPCQSRIVVEPNSDYNRIEKAAVYIETRIPTYYCDGTNQTFLDRLDDWHGFRLGTITHRIIGDC
jgi:hypothetical protein